LPLLPAILAAVLVGIRDHLQGGRRCLCHPLPQLLLSNHPTTHQFFTRGRPEILPWHVKGLQREVHADAMVQQKAQRVEPSVSVIDLIKAANFPWAEQMGRVFDGA
jgi:hypothetical protein